MNPFSAVTSKIFAGVGAFLLIALIVAGLTIRHKNAVIETQRNDLAACNAARAEQNAAITRAGEQARAQQQAFSEAVQSGQSAIAEAQGRVRVVRQTANNGCPTPQAVREAGL